MSEDGDFKVVEGHRRGHMGGAEAGSARGGVGVALGSLGKGSGGCGGGCRGSGLLAVSYLLVPWNGKLFFHSDEQDVADVSMQEESREGEKAENNNDHAKMKKIIKQPLMQHVRQQTAGRWKRGKT